MQAPLVSYQYIAVYGFFSHKWYSTPQKLNVCLVVTIRRSNQYLPEPNVMETPFSVTRTSEMQEASVSATPPSVIYDTEDAGRISLASALAGTDASTAFHPYDMAATDQSVL